MNSLNLKRISLLALVFAIGATVVCATAAKRSTSNINFDPTFGQELVPMSENDQFIDADAMYKCQLKFRFTVCLEHFLRSMYHGSEESYVPMLPELASQELDMANNEKRAAGRGKSSGKRNGANQDEILSFFRNAIAKNMKLKSNIKTTRF